MNTRTQNQIEQLLRTLDTEHSRFPGMTFEQGFEEALRWVLGEIPTDELSVKDPSGV